MLSSENLSCSSKDSDLASGHGDHQAQPPNFSIRDYVFKSRSKDIRTNWPFHEQLLQLCLDNGINDLLPPLQPPNLVRVSCKVESVKLLNSVKNKTGFDNDKSEEYVELEFKLKQGDQSDSSASSMTSHDICERISGLQLKKKCKVNSVKEISMLEDLVSNSIVLSDPMASKVCPVCKLFTSSSNTTLNAHIDQCLSSDQSNAMSDVTDFTKPKVQPRKKRLMVDIYATAPHCTLEDLDRRNGTNWAATLASVTPANDIGLETERTKFAPFPAENDIKSESKRAKVAAVHVVSDGKVGDIYVDSNGTKLLILSKSNDFSPPLVSRKNFKPKKYVKGMKAGQSYSNITKKKILKPKFSEVMIDHPQKRKLRTCKRFKGENEMTTYEHHIGEVNQKKEESTSQLLNAHAHVKNSEPSTLGHWVCSKRSDLSRKLDNKGVTKGSEKLTAGSRNLSLKCPKPNLGHSFLKRSTSLNSSPKSGNSRIHCISLEGMEVDKFITTKKFKKQRSVLGYSKWRGGKTSVSGGIYGSSEDSGLISSRDNETSNTHQSNFYENQENENMNIRDAMCNSIVTPTFNPSSEEDVESISRVQAEEEDESISTYQNEEEENEESISRDQNEEEDEESISRDQTHEKAETSAYNHEVQCEDAINKEIINQEIHIACDQAEQILQHDELQIDISSFEEPNPFPNDGELAFENFQGDSSKYIKVESCQDHNMIVDMESSGSAVSTTSTISPRSPVDDRSNSKADKLAEYNKYNKMLLSSQAREPSCLCSESLSRESQFSNPSRKNLPSNLFIKPPALSSFQIYPNLNFHAESVITMDSSKSAMNISTPRSGAESASSPILRLMGKDLVVSKEDPKILPCGSSYNSEEKVFSFGHLNNSGFIGYNNHYLYPMQSMGNHQVMPHQVMPIPLQRSYAINSYPVPTITPNRAQKVIVIDSEPERRASLTNLPQTTQNPYLMAPQRQYACFPAQNPYASRAFTSTGQREASEGSFMFPSPSSLYFSPSLR